VKFRSSNKGLRKVINAEIEKLKGQKPPFNNNNNNNNQQHSLPLNNKKTWNDSRKRPTPTSYLTEQLKEIVQMTSKKAMQDAKTKFDAQVQDKLHVIESSITEAQEIRKMQDMEAFINHPTNDKESDTEEEINDLTQASLLVTYKQKMTWAESQDIQILYINRDPLLNNYIV
jgi:hypothetical protein